VEFEVRNEGQKQNIIATGISKFFLFLLDSNDVSLQTPSSKVTVTDDEGNNSGVWRPSPQPPEANRGLGAEPSTLWRLRFFKK